MVDEYAFQMDITGDLNMGSQETEDWIDYSASLPDAPDASSDAVL